MKGKNAPPWQRDKLMAMLTAAADAGKPCPSNSEIANALGLTADSDASNLIMLLEHARLIRVARGHQSRIVTIVRTGRSTGNTARLPNRPRVVKPVVDNRFRGDAPEHLRVDRDPCPRCNVRADIGCEHTRGRLVAGVMGLAA